MNKYLGRFFDIIWIPESKVATYREAGIAALLSLVCLALFYPSFKYGFVGDDYDLVTLNTWNQLFGFWESVNYRRPLDELFYFTFYNLFGYNPLPYKIFQLVVFAVNTFLVYRLLCVLTKNQLVGTLVAILFAANTVQFRNIYWISNNILLYSTTFYLVAALLFVRYLEEKRTINLVIAYIVVVTGLLFTKENLVTFPITAVLLAALVALSRKGTISRDDFIPIIRSTAVLWTIPFLFIVLRTLISWILGETEQCPYNLLDCFKNNAVITGEVNSAFQISFMGIHVVKNLALQLFWNFGSLGIYWADMPFNQYAGTLEWRDMGKPEYLLVFGFLAVFVFLYWAFRKSISTWYLIIGLLWFAGNLSPTLVLSDHVHPYFSAFPAIGIILALMMPFLHISNRVDLGHTKIIQVTGFALALLIFANSIYWIHTNEKTHLITRTSVLLQKLEKDLKRMYPAMPKHTNLIFINLGDWVLGYSKAPKVIYNEPSLNIWSADDFLLKNNKVFSKEKIYLDKSRTHVFLRTQNGLQEITSLFIKRYQGVVPENSKRG